MSKLKITTALASAALLAACLTAPAASAAFGISVLDGGASQAPPPGTIDPFTVGPAYTQAAGHPYEAWTGFQVNKEVDDSEGYFRAEGGGIRNVEVDLPPGLIGNPQAVPACPKTRRIVVSTPEYESNPPEAFCSPASVVGTALIATADDPANGFGGVSNFPSHVFSVEPPPGVAASFGLILGGSQTFLDATVRADGEYAVSVRSRNASNAARVLGVRVTLWGNPSDPAHDAQRCVMFTPFPTELLGLFGFPLACSNPLFFPNPPGTPLGENPFPDHLPRIPLLTNPTSCTPAGVGLETTMRVESWDPASAPDEASFVSHQPPYYPAPEETWGPPQGPDDCDQVAFDPEISLTPTSTQADSPTGLTVDLSVPTEGLLDPDSIAQANLKEAVVTLPEGMTVNPSSAAGLGSCAPDQIRMGTNLGLDPSEPTCPDSSKIGTVEVETPLLKETLEGSVYLAKQADNPFSSLLALYIVVKSPERGVIVKLAGKVSPDPVTGRLVTSFEDNPQVPFSNLHLELKSGSRAPLINPPSCGPHTIAAALTPWSDPDGAPVEIEDTFQIATGPGGAPCPNGGFEPAFEAGTVTPIAGAYSPLVVNASRPDGSQPLAGLELDLPEGLLGKLKGTSYCPEASLAAAAAGSGGAELASPSCPASSEVGSVTVGAGAGPAPFHATGKAYLAGPYKGAPLSVAVITPAVAGPFDLGTVVVRSKADVDPVTAKIHVTSDPIPTILQGIPLKVRSVSVNTDRPEFTLNPTDCDPASFGGTLFGTSTSKLLSSRFQVGACRALGFKPKLALRLSGGTKRGQNPALRATLTMPEGQANIERVSVALPHSEFLDQAHIRTICTRVQFAAEACPPGSVYGTARAFTPLLDQPLEGPVYLRSSNNPLPDLVIALKGQIDVDLAGRIDSVNGGIRNTFTLVPDAPVSKFVLEMKGGRKGLLVNSEDICASTNRATVKMDAQSGRVHDFRPALKAKGCGRGR